MTRLAYRAALSLLLAGLAIALADLTAHGHGVPPLLGAVAAGYSSAVVLVYALGAAWHAGHAQACRLGHRGIRRPDRRRVVPGAAPVDQQARAQADEWARGTTMVAANADSVTAPTIAYTSALPIVAGVVGRFDGAGVGDAIPGPWTLPVGPAGRHAGTAASDLSEWGAFEYARPQ